MADDYSHYSTLPITAYIRTWPSAPTGLRIKGFGRTATSPSAPSKNATTSGSTRPRPRRPSHEIAFSARLRGTSFKSALPGRQIGSRTWSGAGRGVSDETKLELGSVDRRVAGFPRSD